MAKGTPATSVLEKAGIAFKLHEYDYDPNAERIGMQAADALGVSPSRLLKTLMAKAGGAVVCVLIASDREVSLKKLAAAAGAKDAAMLPAAEAERITGYHVGGISPLGQRKRVRGVHRCAGARASDDHLQRRPPRLADRDRAAGTGEAPRRTGLNSLRLLEQTSVSSGARRPTASRRRCFAARSVTKAGDAG